MAVRSKITGHSKPGTSLRQPANTSDVYREPETSLQIPEAAQHRIPSSTSAHPLLNSQQAARYLGVHPRTLTRLARDGEIPALQIGRHWRFRISDLDAWTQSKISCSAKLKALSASTEKGDLA